MALPENFNSFENLQSTFMLAFKNDVREEFNDLGDDNWEPDISVPRGRLRVACTPTDTDTADMLIMRALLFYFPLRKAQDMQAPIMGMPLWDVMASRKFSPQIQFFFSQDRSEMVASQVRPVTGQFSFRLKNETSETITKTELTTMANKIKQAFNSPSEGIWYRGRNMATYTDLENGYKLQILTDTKEHAKDLIQKVLGLQDIVYNSDRLNYVTCDNAAGKYPANPPNKTILGVSRKQPVARRICTIRFRYATAWVHGLNSKIALYDRSGKYLAPLAI